MFNEYFTASDGAKLAFNSYSCALAVVDDSYEKLMNQVSTLSSSCVPDELRDCFDAAVEGHFIVDDDFDELIDLSTKRNLQKYSTESLGLTIAPTLACNFKCIYCYETSKPGIMSNEIQQALVDFVEYQSNHLKDLSVAWYGGEPLIAKDVVYSLSEKFIEICNKKGINYNAFMISNGSLIDDEVIKKMIQYSINGIQITIDGPPEIHNKRRINKQGSDTFDLLIDNINKLLRTEKIEVVIRINVDKSNNSEVDKLLSIFNERLISKRVKITFGQVTAYTEACHTIESTCYNNGEFAIELLKYYKLLSKYGFMEYNDFPYPEVKVNYCCAELINSFVVDHEGYLYKCWNEVGNIPRAVGNISNDIYDITSYKNGYWVLRDPISFQKCSTCSLLPICMGGCPHSNIILNQESPCDLIKYNITDVMLKYYEMSKENKE